MCRVHLDPGEALAARATLGARQMLPMHYDTFVNSFDEFGEAGRRLRAEMAAQGLSDEELVTLAHGERRVFAWK